eukprot:CAMPEP_0185410002 /NCGR_PEP_ID=MMETSP1365-20130426/2847_1 /TAXON_ID=38817 /ORGANISM="Gephyrocapsa oceanica, Strain RCC1303" /LENGTH=68 /DNA_ID=CAMNT_0028012601 /DNA_START=17 /DNA_END=219 /DNA_ORIENTATION=-
MTLSSSSRIARDRGRSWRSAGDIVKVVKDRSHSSPYSPISPISPRRPVRAGSLAHAHRALRSQGAEGG